MTSRDRIQSLDILRGLALLGMFIVHFHSHTTEPGGIDDLVRTLTWRLVETKSHGTFALLFGAGFALQLRRAQFEGRGFAVFYLPRLAVLAVFGFAAHALFGFNVLLGYAVWGVPLLVVGRWPTRALLVTAVLSAASVSMYRVAVDQYREIRLGPVAASAVVESRRAEAIRVNESLRAAEEQPSYRVLLAARLSYMAWFHAQPFFFLPGATLALFIVGALLVRHGVLEDPLAHRLVLGVMAIGGIMSWLGANWALGRWHLAWVAGIIRDQWLAFTYVSVALWLLARYPSLNDALRGVANAGRMALTNYLLQIVAIDLLFSGYAVGLGLIRPTIGWAAALTCFLAELTISTRWLAHFRMGPAEWLWRSLTYCRRGPFAREVGR